MTKSDMLKALEPYGDDAPIILVLDENGGWTNIGEIIDDRGTAQIVADYTLPFSDE